jgi:hypothetical protein
VYPSMFTAFHQRIQGSAASAAASTTGVLRRWRGASNATSSVQDAVLANAAVDVHSPPSKVVTFDARAAAASDDDGFRYRALASGSSASSGSGAAVTPVVTPAAGRNAHTVSPTAMDAAERSARTQILERALMPPRPRMDTMGREMYDPAADFDVGAEELDGSQSQLQGQGQAHGSSRATGVYRPHQHLRSSSSALSEDVTADVSSGIRSAAGPSSAVAPVTPAPAVRRSSLGRAWQASLGRVRNVFRGGATPDLPMGTPPQVASSANASSATRTQHSHDADELVASRGGEDEARVVRNLLKEDGRLSADVLAVPGATEPHGRAQHPYSFTPPGSRGSNISAPIFHSGAGFDVDPGSQRYVETHHTSQHVGHVAGSASSNRSTPEEGATRRR